MLIKVAGLSSLSLWKKEYLDTALNSSLHLWYRYAITQFSHLVTH